MDSLSVAPNHANHAETSKSSITTRGQMRHCLHAIQPRTIKMRTTMHMISTRTMEPTTITRDIRCACLIFNAFKTISRPFQDHSQTLWDNAWGERKYRTNYVSCIPQRSITSQISPSQDQNMTVMTQDCLEEFEPAARLCARPPLAAHAGLL
jgi:hypothetical protein